MRLSPKSLRKKIFLGYIAGAVMVLGFVLLSWSNLNKLEDMVKSGEIVSDLFDATLEIRRFEKNFFLYKTAEDYSELVSYVEKSDQLIERPELEIFASSDVIRQLEQSVHGYRDQLKSGINGLDAKEEIEWEKHLRVLGHEIVTIAENISKYRKEIKRNSLTSAKRHLLTGIAILILAGIAAGIFFYKKAVRPLSVIEQHMNRISDGEFSLIDTKFKDSEILSLKVAFNKMLLEIQTRQSHLVQSERLASMGTLVFGVAHELNNPLSNIYTSAQILSEEIEGADIDHKKELLAQIESETERARDVVGTVLDYSRSKEKTTFNLNRAIGETIRLIKAEIPAGVTVATNLPEDISIFADKQKIQQVILNLVSNALDAIDEDGEISISASHSDGMIEILVQDNGAGMSQDTLSKIFDPFFSSKKTKKGYGLGLFVVHNIIQEHGGSISADSSPNVGTVFTITLPEKES